MEVEKTNRERIIICADVSFPNGDPGAHRIHYIAKSMQDGEKGVVIISHGRPNSVGKIDKYDGIPYLNLDGKMSSQLVKIFGGFLYCGLLKTLSVSSKDVVYIYGNNGLILFPIFLFCKSHGIKMYIDIVEWHQPYQYKHGKLNPRYKMLNYTFEKLAPKIHNIIVISKRLQDHFVQQNCNVMIVPPLTNFEEVNGIKCNEVSSIRHFIYPGNPLTKDDIEVMLKSIDILPDAIKNKMWMHFTGVSEKKIRAFLKEKANLLDRTQSIITFHGFLDYTELEKLYKMVDFLLLPRYENLVTESNFPSKIPELMKWGIIPVGNRIGDYHLYLEDGVDAFLFDSDCASCCAESIIRAVESPDKQIIVMKKNAQKCVRNQFDYRKWSKKINDFVKLE